MALGWASHHPQLQQRAGVGHRLDVGMRLQAEATGVGGDRKGQPQGESLSRRTSPIPPELSCARPPALLTALSAPPPQAQARESGGPRGLTHHCCELVELGPQVGAPEVDVGGFIPHLVAVGTGDRGQGQSSQ